MPDTTTEDESKQPLLSADEKEPDNDEEAPAPVPAEEETQEEEEPPRSSSKRPSGKAVLRKVGQTLRPLQALLAIPLMEALGTLLLTLVVGLLTRPSLPHQGDPLTTALAIAAVLAAAIYAGAGISGANYNPAVTFGLLLLRKLSPFQGLVYIGSQVGGAVGGAYLAQVLAHPETLTDPTTSTVDGRLVLVEISFTFALVFVILHTAVARAQQPNSFAGAAICSTLAAAVAAGGAVMNPAVSTGLFVATGTNDGLWVRWLLPLVGAFVAVGFFLMTNAEEMQAVVDGTSQEEEGEEEEAAAEVSRRGRGRTLSSSASLSFSSYAHHLTHAARVLGPYVMEFVGVYLLTLTVVFSLATKDVSTPATAGLMLAGLVFGGGYVSGCHVNSAVTLGVFLYRPRTKEVPKAVGYVFAQVVGALVASVLAKAALGHAACQNALPVPQAAHTWQQALGAEMTFTALLVLTILLLAAGGTQNHMYFGWAIAAALSSGLWASGSISGGGLNPAVASALYVANAASDQRKHLWIYWIGPLLGAVTAVVVAELCFAPGGRLVGSTPATATKEKTTGSKEEAAAASKEAGEEGKDEEAPRASREVATQ